MIAAQLSSAFMRAFPWPSLIWIAFAAIFAALAAHHCEMSRHTITPLTVTERPFAGQIIIQGAGAELDKPLKDFAVDFNKYLSEQNSHWHDINIASFWGYVIAALTAAFSLCRELATFYGERGDIRHDNDGKDTPQVGLGISGGPNDKPPA